MAGEKGDKKSHPKNTERLKAVATYVKDSKRFHRYDVEGEDDDVVVGNLYITKGTTHPEKFRVTLTPID